MCEFFNFKKYILTVTDNQSLIIINSKNNGGENNKNNKNDGDKRITCTETNRNTELKSRITI